MEIRIRIEEKIEKGRREASLFLESSEGDGSAILAQAAQLFSELKGSSSEEQDLNFFCYYAPSVDCLYYSVYCPVDLAEKRDRAFLRWRGVAIDCIIQAVRMTIPIELVVR